MAHNRKLVLGGVALTMARIRPAATDAAAINLVRDELEREMIDSGYLRDAPFKWIGLIIRYGIKDEEEPHYQKIRKQDGELPVAIEIDTNRLLGASGDQMARTYRETVALVLVRVGEKYGLPTQVFKALLAQSAS